jgi:hypothetical protein
MIPLGSRYYVLRKSDWKTVTWHCKQHFDCVKRLAASTAHWSLSMNGKMIKVDKHTKPRATNCDSISLDGQTYGRHMTPSSSTGIPTGHRPIKSETIRITSKLAVGKGPLTFRNRASYIQDRHTATLQTPHFIYFSNKYTYWIYF